MLKKITGSILTIMLMTTMFLGAISVAAPEPVHAATYTGEVNGANLQSGDILEIGSKINRGNWIHFFVYVDNVSKGYKYMAYNISGDRHTVEKVVADGNVGEVWLKKGAHTHTWSATASGSTITTKCTGSGTCPDGGSTAKTLTLNADNATYDGNSHSASTSGEYYSQAGTPGSIYYEGINGTEYSSTMNAPKNAGSYRASISLGSATATKDFTISPLEATLDWTDTELTYNGTNQKPKATVSNRVGSDTCNVTVTGEQKDAGQSYTATATELSNSNYALPSSNTTTFKINKAPLTLTGVTAINKTYDGNATAVLEGTAALAGMVEGDDVEIDQISGQYSDKNVGEDKEVSLEVTLKGEDAGNYVVTSGTTLEADIEARTVTVKDGIIALDKTYDGNTTATLNLSGANLDGKISGDDLGVTATGAFGDETAAEGKTVTISGHALTGSDALNYELATSGNQTTTTASINKKELKVSGVTADNKTYDGITDATIKLDNPQYDGKIAGDEVSVDLNTTTGKFEDKNVGPNKTVNVTLGLTGADAGNYIAKPATAVTADIEASMVTVSGITVDTRQYNKTTEAPLNTGNAQIDGIVAGDTVTVSGTGTYTDGADVGVGKPVMITDLTLGGADAGNYSVSAESQSAATGTVTKRDIKVSGITAKDKTYDGKTDATLVFTGVQLGGNLDGDDLQLVDSHFTGSFDNKDAGAGKTVNISISEPDTALTGDAAGNYKLADKGQQDAATASINKASITITADDKSSQYKHKLADLTYQIGGKYVKGDELGVELTTTASRTAAPGEYPIEVSWNNDPNYSATLNNGKYTITKANATITVSGYEGVYDGKEHSITVEVEDKGYIDALLDLLKSFFGEENEKAEATVYYSDKTELTAENYKTEGSLENPSYKNASDNTVYYYIVLSDHYETTDRIAGSKEVKITKAPLTVTADPKTKTYGEEDPKLTYKVEGTIEGEEDLIKVELERESGEAKGTYKIKDKSIKATDNYAVTYVPADFVIKPASEDGKIIEETVNRNDPPKTTATNLDKIANSLLTEEEKQAMKDGARVRIWVEVTGLKESAVPSGDKAKLDAAAKNLGLTPGRWMDISLFKEVTGFGVTQLHDVDVPVELLTEVPRDLRKSGRVFYILRCHKGSVSTLASTTSNSISYVSDGFSTYMLAYKDPENSKGSKGAKTGDPNDIAGLLALMLASGGALGAMGYRRRRENQR